MSDDKVNMALDDIIKLNKRKRAGKVVKRSTERVRQVKGRSSTTSRGRGGLARRRGAPLNIGQRRGARTRFIQRRGIGSPSTNVAVVDNAATRRFVKKLVNIYADAALTGVSVRSRGIRKRVVQVPRIVVRRPRRIRSVRRSQVEEEPEQFVYQPVRVVEREPSPTQMIRRRQVRPVYRNERATVRVLQNSQRAAVTPARQFIQQRSAQFPIRRSRVFAQQQPITRKALIGRNVYGAGRQNPRANVIYVNEEMSSRVHILLDGGGVLHSCGIENHSVWTYKLHPSLSLFIKAKTICIPRFPEE
uniref:Uncharacterized protein n=1 Tax=Angiostrongylus cantonensis TaxID=6313 RepID=A0A0K0CX08_ANGCA